MSPDPVLAMALRLGLALLLSAAAIHKLRDRATFRAALANYEIVPEGLLPLAAATLPGVELGLAVALLLPRAGVVAALGVALLFALYAGAIAVNLRRGRRHIDCGCAGPGARRPLSGSLVARNSILVLAAGLAAIPAPARPWVWIDALSVCAATLTFAVLYVAADLCIENQPRLRAWRGSP